MSINMRWGEELWDGFDRISKYIHEGIQFIEQYEEFLKERCSIENAYAKSLRKLIKNYEVNRKSLQSNLPITYQIVTNSTGVAQNSSATTKDLSIESCRLSHLKCFNRNLNEIKDIAGQHELIAENIQKRIIEKLNSLIRSFKDDRRKCIDEKEKFYTIHQNCDELLKKSKVKYESSFKETEKSKEILQKIEQDDSSSRLDIRKQQTVYEQKLRVCESHKADYANQLCLANTIKGKYYDEQLPQCINQLQTIEEKRINQLKTFLNEAISIETEVLPRIERCYKECDDAINSVSIDNDIDCVVNAFKTGYVKPADHLFEDLSEQQHHLNNSQNTSTASNLNHEIHNGSNGPSSNTISRAAKYRTLGRLRGLLKPKNELETLYDLPPQQQKKELKKKIETLTVDIAKEQKEREGLLKLKEIYTNNEKFGNSESALAALRNNEEKLQALNGLLNKYKCLYDECERNGTLSRARTNSSTTTSATLPNAKLNHSNSQGSIEDENTTNQVYSLPNTPMSQHSNQVTNNTTKQTTNENTTSTTIGTFKIDVQRSKYASAESFDDDDVHENDTIGPSNYDNTNPNFISSTSQQVSSAIVFAESQYEHIDNRMPIIDTLTTNTTNIIDYDEQIIGNAFVKYEFKGNVQNAISIKENEHLQVLEKDSGDGWTLVKRDNGDKGYVPTDYIQIEYF